LLAALSLYLLPDEACRSEDHGVYSNAVERSGQADHLRYLVWPIHGGASGQQATEAMAD
jgi:hypothetical protein